MISKTTKWIIAGTVLATLSLTTGGLMGYHSIRHKHAVNKTEHTPNNPKENQNTLSTSNSISNTNNTNSEAYKLKEATLDLREAALDAKEAALELEKVKSELEKIVANQNNGVKVDYRTIVNRPVMYNNYPYQYYGYDMNRRMLSFMYMNNGVRLMMYMNPTQYGNYYYHSNRNYNHSNHGFRQTPRIRNR